MEYKKMKGEDELLTAKLSNNEVISLINTYSRSQLQELKTKESFYCRSCSEKVILKLGSKRIFHFAHEKGSTCTEDYDRESQYHLTGKLDLYGWLKEQGLSPELECYFSAIHQRADIAFYYQGNMYAIEFQCSVIDENLFKKRTAGYRKISVIPIWILGGKNIHRLGPQKVSLSGFHYMFLTEHGDSTAYLPSYCPQAKKFITIENLVPISTRNAHCTFSIRPLEKISIKALIQPNKPFFMDWKEWRKDMARFKRQVLTSTTSIKDPFLLELYTHSLNPYLLPPYVGIPLKYNFALETPPFIWQAYFFIDHLHQQEIGKKISFHEAYTKLLRRVIGGQIKTRVLPDIKKNLVPFVLLEYLSFLTKMGMLREEKQNCFVVAKTIKVPHNMGDCQLEEEQFYSKENIWRISHIKIK